MDLSVVIPAYNEAHRIGATLAAMRAYAETALGASSYEVIVVCDGCRDATAEVVRESAHGLPLQLVAYPENRGKGYAVRQGVAKSSGHVVAFMDADGATPVRELGRLTAPIVGGQADIVVGSRRAHGARVTPAQPLWRQLLGRVFALHARLVLGLCVVDTQCGFKVFRGQVAREMFADLGCDGFAFDLEVLAAARERRLRVLEMGIEWHPVAGSSLRPWRDGLRMLRETWQIRARRRSRRRAGAG